MMRFLTILLCAFVTVTQAEEIALPKCPTGKFEAVISCDDDPQNSKIVFRVAGTSTPIGTFNLGGYATYAKLLWSPSGHFAAVQTHFTRHTLEAFVFEITDAGIKQAKLQDYTQNIYGRLNILHGGRGSSETPLKWLSDDRLLIQAAGTLADQDADYWYDVELRMISDADDVVGWLEKIEKATTHVPPTAQ